MSLSGGQFDNRFTAIEVRLRITPATRKSNRQQ